MKGFATLPGVAASGNEQLRREIAMARERGETPDTWPELPVSPSLNASVVLSRSLSGNISPRMREKVAEYFYHDMWLDDAETIESLDRFLDFHHRLLGEIDQATALRQCRFDCGFEYGYFARLEFLNHVEFAVRVLLLDASRLARQGDAERAYQRLEQALTWCSRLARAPRLEPRLLAANLRAETLHAAQRLLEVEALRVNEAQTLYGFLRGDLANWPDESEWVAGDAAVGMHTYEALRAGMLDKVLTGHETAALREQGRLEPLMSATDVDLDQDQLNYLDAVRILVEGDAPYYLRIESIEQARETASRAPGLFAEEILLGEAFDGLSVVAVDRALCEAWCIVLAESLGIEPPPFRVNPHNGRPYEHVHEKGEVVVLLYEPTAHDPRCPGFKTRSP